MRTTIKAIRGAAIIAQKYGVTLAQVLANEDSGGNMYLELRADGYTWNSVLKRWLLDNAARAGAGGKEIKRLPCQVRIIAEDMTACALAREFVGAALRAAGYEIQHESELKQNYGDAGARMYFEVLL